MFVYVLNFVFTLINNLMCNWIYFVFDSPDFGADLSINFNAFCFLPLKQIFVP